MTALVWKKAAVTVCLFLCLAIHAPAEEQWKFTATTQRAYDLVFRLDFAGIHALIPEPQTVDELYVISLAEAIELILEEDGKKYADYQNLFQQRRDRRFKQSDPLELFLQAELAVQWAFVYFKFGHEFDAALNLREAYTITAQVRKRHPQFEAIRKTAALLEVIVGSVPEKYNWVLSLLGIQGSVENGLRLFESMNASNSPLRQESAMLHALVRCYVLQQTNESVSLFDDILREHPGQPLALFLGASVCIKNAESAKAMEMLQQVDTLKTFQLDYASYLLGEVYLYNAAYLNSITAFRKFLNHYKGQNNIKDATYKIGLCYWLNGNINDAMEAFRSARNVGRDITEADKYAARSLAETALPHRKLTAARYATDGGYYENARQILGSISAEELSTTRDQVEYYYRNARLDHKTYRLDAAKENYLKVIELNGAANWYFAPNACLQLGYLYAYERDDATAVAYFDRALSYKKHEYKNSIDTKARSARAQLRRK